MKLFFVSVVLFVVLVIELRYIQAEEYEYEDYEDEVPMKPSSTGGTSPSTTTSTTTGTTAASTTTATGGSSEEYEYEYEYEDEEDEAQEVVAEAPPSNVRGPEHNGYILHGSGGLMRISKPLVDELFLNETAAAYDCAKREEAFMLMLEADPEMDETNADMLVSQVNELRSRLEKIQRRFEGKSSNESQPSTGEEKTTGSSQPNATATAGNGNAKAQTESASSPKKRLSFRDKQAQRMREKKERIVQKEKTKPKFRLGADCETLLCGSCKAVVEEFSEQVFAQINNPKMKYLDQVFDGLCDSRNILLKYNNMVNETCRFFEEETRGYKEALISAFEADSDWQGVRKHSSLNLKKQKVCVDIGACDLNQFQFQSTPILRTQEHWDDKCFVCQAFAKDLEERLQLHRQVTEGSVVSIVASTCDRLNLEPRYYDVCKPLTVDKLLDDISWLAKVHSESIAKRAKGEQKFEDKLCEEINWCKPWEDPKAVQERQAEQTVEAVFF